MIETLSIRDFALVDRLTLELEPGFTVLTGETGAGKSILLQALGLLLGDRASRDLVRTGAPSARVEGVFQLSGGTKQRVEALLEEAGVVVETPMVVVRTVTAEGKSRAHVNGASVGVALLSKVGAHLVEVSSQHQHQALLDEANHLSILDAALDEEGRTVLQDYRKAFSRWNGARATLQRLETMESDAVSRRDFLQFQIEEVRAAGLEPEGDARLEEERDLLAHAEKLTEAYSGAEADIYTDPDCALDRVGRAKRAVERAMANDPAALKILELLSEASASLEEAARALRDRCDAVRSDPGRLEIVEDRLDLIRRLERKHGVGVSGILKTLEKMERELWELDNRQVALDDARLEEERARSALGDAGEKLRAVREATARRFSDTVGGELEALGLGRAAFRVDIAPAAPGPDGADAVRFVLAPNPGEEPRALARIASGGELSRILLGVKNALRDDTVQTLIFDEVDAGIGGQVAERVGERLVRLSEACQVICVTHLPQIASRTERHQRVEKQVEAGRTVTLVRRLTPDERVEELARMLGGREVGDAAYEHARYLAARE